MSTTTGSLQTYLTLTIFLNSIFYTTPQTWSFILYAFTQDINKTDKLTDLFDGSELTRTDQWLLTNFTRVFQPIPCIPDKLTNQFQRTRLITWSTDKHYSLDSEDDFRSGCRNVSHQQHFFSGLQCTFVVCPHPDDNMHKTSFWYSWAPFDVMLRLKCVNLSKVSSSFTLAYKSSRENRAQSEKNANTRVGTFEKILSSL